MPLSKLTGKEAGAAFDNDPASVGFTLGSFLANFGLTEQEIHAELSSGRLIAQGRPTTTGGFADITISAKALLDWVANVHTPLYLVDKVSKAIEDLSLSNRDDVRAHRCT